MNTLRTLGATQSATLRALAPVVVLSQNIIYHRQLDQMLPHEAYPQTINL